MDEQKKYIEPIATIIVFSNEDIIVASGEEWWGHGNIGGVDGPNVP